MMPVYTCKFTFAFAHATLCQFLHHISCLTLKPCISCYFMARELLNGTLLIGRNYHYVDFVLNFIVFWTRDLQGAGQILPHKYRPWHLYVSSYVTAEMTPSTLFANCSGAFEDSPVFQEFPHCNITVNWTIVTVAPAFPSLPFYVFHGLVANLVLCQVNHVCLWWWFMMNSGLCSGTCPHQFICENITCLWQVFCTRH